MIEFPTILYKCPGIWSGNGYSFATRPANDREEFDAAVSDGWHPTVPLAVEAWRKPVAAAPTNPVPPSVPLPEDAPPTRAEIAAMLPLPSSTATNPPIMGVKTGTARFHRSERAGSRRTVNRSRNALGRLPPCNSSAPLHNDLGHPGSVVRAIFQR